MSVLSPREIAERKIAALRVDLEKQTDRLKVLVREIRITAETHHSEDRIEEDIFPAMNIAPFMEAYGWVSQAVLHANRQRTIVFGIQQKILVLNEVLRGHENDI